MGELILLEELGIKLADNLSPRYFEVVRSFETWYKPLMLILVLSEGIVTLTVSPSNIDLADPDALCLIAYEASVYLVQQKVLEFDAVATSVK